jgi:cell wall-associated NlpC family hydrolase
VATARFARPLAIILSLVAGLSLLVVGPALHSAAAPTLTIGQVEARISALNTAAEKITERYDAAHEALAALQTQQRVANDQLTRDQRQLAGVRKLIGATANYAYRNGGLGGVTDLTSMTDPQAFLDSSAMLDEVSRYQAQQFAAVAAAQHNVTVAQSTVDAKAAAARRTLAAIAEDKAHIEGLLAQARGLLASLRAADRARLNEQASALAARQYAMRFSYNGPASGRAAAAVRFAYAQLGKPYQYGGTGPGSYDCSGLTMRSWEAGGVSLPRTAAEQQSATHYVSAANLQPGDLVFFGSPAYHVAIYIGGGRIIAAPHTGTVVQIQSLSSESNFAGGGRP